jgi:hypothetical protein
MPWTQGNTQNTGFEIVLSNLEAFQKKFFDVLYTETFWRDVIPEESILTDIPEGAKSTSYGVRDYSGTGAFLGSRSQDVPTVDLSYRKETLIPIFDAGIAGVITRSDMRTYQFAYGKKMNTELTAKMGKAADNHIEGVVFYGDSSINFEGWLDTTGVEVIQAPVGGSGQRSWFEKTPLEILRDINLAMAQVRENTGEVFVPGGVYLPGEHYDHITTTPVGDNADKSIADYVKGNNIYTNRTGKELKIKSIPHLKEAGPLGVNRAVFQTEESPEENFGLPFPIPMRLLPPQIRGYELLFLGEYKFGSFYKPRPETAVYLDEI